MEHDVSDTEEQSPWQDKRMWTRNYWEPRLGEGGLARKNRGAAGAQTSQTSEPPPSLLRLRGLGGGRVSAKRRHHTDKRPKGAVFRKKSPNHAGDRVTGLGRRGGRGGNGSRGPRGPGLRGSCPRDRALPSAAKPRGQAATFPSSLPLRGRRKMVPTRRFAAKPIPLPRAQWSPATRAGIKTLCRLSSESGGHSRPHSSGREQLPVSAQHRRGAGIAYRQGRAVPVLTAAQSGRRRKGKKQERENTR